MNKKAKVITITIIVTIAIVVLGVRHYQLTRVEKIRLLDSTKRYNVLKSLHTFLMRAAYESKTEPFIMYGTLLGHIRNNDIICWDFDLDYAIMHDSYHRLHQAVKTLIKEYPNFKMGSTLEPTLFNINMFKVVDKETGLNLDVNSMIERSKDGKRMLSKDYPRLLSKYWYKERQLDFNYDDFFPLKPISFLDYLTFMPNNPEPLLKSWYGNSYLTPDRTCNCIRCENKKLQTQTDQQTQQTQPPQLKNLKKMSLSQLKENLKEW